jgi:hypothetical protein
MLYKKKVSLPKGDLPNLAILTFYLLGGGGNTGSSSPPVSRGAGSASSVQPAKMEAETSMTIIKRTALIILLFQCVLIEKEQVCFYRLGHAALHIPRL